MKTCFGCLSLVLIPLFLLVLIILMLLGALFYGTHSSNGGKNDQIVQNALAMAEHLHDGGANNYDVVMDVDFPQEALRYWDSLCGSGCGWAQNGNLQCGVFVAMAYGWAGLPLVNVPTSIDWWTSAYARNHQPGWTEIPNGTGAPVLGDILILASPNFGGEGHSAIVVNITPTSLTFAEANGPAPFVTWSLDAQGALIAGWANYTVKGFIRYVTPGLPGTPPASPSTKGDEHLLSERNQVQRPALSAHPPLAAEALTLRRSVLHAIS